MVTNIPGSDTVNDKILMLLAHAALGRRLLPTVWVEDGRCSCMERESKDDTRVCSRNKPGKHPRIGEWQHRATDDQDQILEWHAWQPKANWAWVQDKTFTLDVDTKRGGLESLTQWVEEADGPWPTLTQDTPSGGMHFIYRQPPDHQITVMGDVLPGIEIRGIGSYIMIDPSTGLDGPWRFRDLNIMPADADDFTLALIAKHGIDDTLGGDGIERRGVVFDESGKRKETGVASDLPKTDWFMRNGLGGHSGSRNKDAYRLSWRLLALGKKNPQIYTPTYMAGILKQCWLATEQGDSPFTWQECLGALQSAWRRKDKQDREKDAGLLVRGAALAGKVA